MDFFTSGTGHWVLGIIFAFVAAGSAYVFRVLTFSGALAAFVMGSLVFGVGGWTWAAILIAFFLTSNGWSLLFHRKKAQSEKKYAKGSRRDAAQVLANGGVAMGMVILQPFTCDSLLPWIGFCASLAAANADTWATELGALNRGKPILITSGKRVEPGTSGAISLAGTLAATAGGVLIAGLAWLLNPAQTAWWITALIAISGLLGSLVDSLLGATLQANYYCPACQTNTEQHPLHGCGEGTFIVKGFAWLNNDWVNAACTLSGAVFGVLVFLLL